MRLVRRPYALIWYGYVIAALCSLAFAQSAQPQYPDYPSETPQHFQANSSTWDYTRRAVMIPMRDGIKLHTVILVPKGANHAPILLTRTPYDADALTSHTTSSHLGPELWGYDNETEVIDQGGY